MSWKQIMAAILAYVVIASVSVAISIDPAVAKPKNTITNSPPRGSGGK
jgi:hypothetical protein